ncbi:hypothetical protein V5799_033459 [Amblyomma americanum]|uniref:Uncharacterized protein n=1 Tax=Amblyomma americanum TaxID=6943 RepID=A0AAQ4DN92_AMBAM
MENHLNIDDETKVLELLKYWCCPWVQFSERLAEEPKRSCAPCQLGKQPMASGKVLQFLEDAVSSAC